MSTARFILTLILVLALLAPGASQSLAQPAASSAAPASPAVPGAMLIVENAGQWPAAARFQVWNSPLGPGTTWLAEDAIWLVVAGGKSQVAGSEGPAGPLADMQPAHLQPATLHALKLTFPGSNPDVRIEPFGAVDTTVSYFIGNDPAQWRPDVPVWSGVRYVDLYPGVDLVFGGRIGDWRLEPTPGAAIEQVRVQVEGAHAASEISKALQLAVSGEPLSIALPAAPFIYQVAGLSSEGNTQVRAVHPEPPPSQLTSFVDDPDDLLYSTFLGGNGSDYGLAIAVDGTGSAYVTGVTYSGNFPTTPGTFDPTFGGGEVDAFVVKLNSAGSGLAYATFLGGNERDQGLGIDVDALGDAYVTGNTLSSNFPTTPGAFDRSHNGSDDAFVAKLNPAGSALVYATFLGGSGGDVSRAIVADEAGNAYITGWGSSDFPITPGSFDTSYNGDGDAFVAKLNAGGSGLVYSTFLGGSDNDLGSDIAVDEAGSVYMVGATRSSDFPATPGTFDPTYNGGDCSGTPCFDAFVAKLSSAGSGLVYSTFLGGTDYEWGEGIAVDVGGNAYVTGGTDSSDFPTTPGAFDRSHNGWTDGFVVKLNQAGSGLAYATFLGGTGCDWGRDIAVDREGRAFIAGETDSGDFPTTPSAFDPSYNGPDGFVSILNHGGSGLAYSTFLGGGGGKAIFADVAGNSYVTGSTGGGDFPTTPGAFDTSFNGGNSDAFVAKLNTMPYAPNVLAPIEQPTAGAFVSGAVTLRGFAIDRASATGTGVDAVHIYLDGPYGTGTIIGAATYGLDRPDIAAQYGARFGPSGWELAWNTVGVSPGVHRLYLYAHRTTDNAWSLMDPHLVIVPGGPARWLPIILRTQ